MRRGLSSFEGPTPFSSISFGGRGATIRDGIGGMVGGETHSTLDAGVYGFYETMSTVFK